MFPRQQKVEKEKLFNWRLLLMKLYFQSVDLENRLKWNFVNAFCKFGKTKDGKFIKKYNWRNWHGEVWQFITSGRGRYNWWEIVSAGLVCVKNLATASPNLKPSTEISEDKRKSCIRKLTERYTRVVFLITKI